MGDYDYNDQVHEIMDLVLTIPGNKIVTIAGDGFDQSFDIDASGAIGYELSHASQLASQILRCFDESGVIVVCQFTDERDSEEINGKIVQVPIKNLYGIMVDGGKWHRIPSDALRLSYLTDAKTGKPLKPEKTVRYCDLP